MAIDSQNGSFSPSSPNEKTTTYNIDDLTSSSQSAGSDSSKDQGQNQVSTQGSAIDLLRGSVVGVLDSVAREYEPQIAEFTSNLAHQAVDRGVNFASTAAARVQKQSWLRIGVAAALGIGALAILTYEATAMADNTASGNTGRRTH